MNTDRSGYDHQRSCHQSGLALLLVLAVLFTLGSASIAFRQVMPSAQRTTAAGITPAEQQLLIDARQALISYASLYPVMYGPRGAGPAHLPCPDTDGETAAQSAHGRFMHLQRRDGPDPPCGSAGVSSGYLPRHISLPDQRYQFHTEARQWLHYRVSGRVINNPTNRVINPGLLLSDEVSALAAAVEIPTVVASHAPNHVASHAASHAPSHTLSMTANTDANSVRARVVIPLQELIEDGVPIVANWVMQRAAALTTRWCHGPESSQVVQAINLWDCLPYQRLIQQCPEDAALLISLDHLPQPTGSVACGFELAVSQLMEAVPASRHWFVRNRWFDWVGIGDHTACTQVTNPATLCRLQWRPIRHSEYAGPGDGEMQSSGLPVFLTWNSTESTGMQIPIDED